MKYIKKNSFAPKKLKEWFDNLTSDENGCLINGRYGNLPSDLHEELHQVLLEEQGFLCCYTGLRIDEQKSHIEHIKPQCISKKDPHDHDDVNYHNMLAAYPKEKNLPKNETKTKECPFGAKFRGDKELAVSPLSPECERKFIFELDGGIESANPDTENKEDRQDDASKTIRALKLDHSSLVKMRKAAIEGFFLDKDDHVITRSQMERLINQEGICKKDQEGRYPKFCFVIEQVARLMLEKAEREKKRKQAIQKSQNQKNKRSAK
jgi:uncharacterized protein (TIGR02646 family)